MLCFLGSNLRLVRGHRIIKKKGMRLGVVRVETVHVREGRPGGGGGGGIPDAPRFWGMVVVVVDFPASGRRENWPSRNHFEFASSAFFCRDGSTSSIPWTGVNDNDEAVPEVDDSEGAEFCKDSVGRLSVASRSLFALDIRAFDDAFAIVARTFPLAFVWIIPSPIVSSNAPASSSSLPNSTRFCIFRISVSPCISRNLRARRPPRRCFRPPSLGTGSALMSFAGGGSMSFSILRAISSNRDAPYRPVAVCAELLFKSMRAANEAFALTIRSACIRYSSGV